MYPTVHKRVTARGRAQSRRAAPAFTLVEMIVVTVVIALVLAIGLPAFNSMSLSSHFSKARQQTSGVLTRANIVASADRTLTAVRVVPTAWEIDPSGSESSPIASGLGRQALITYRYTASNLDTTANLSAGQAPDVVLSERFTRMKDGATAILPAETWLAPVEATFGGQFPADLARDQYDGSRWLRGTTGLFRVNCADPVQDNEFLDMDDYLIVFDPDNGVVLPKRSVNGATDTRTAWRMRSTYITENPALRRETDFEPTGLTTINRNRPFQRYSASGVVIYERELFRTAGPSASTAQEIDKRRQALLRTAQQFYISSTSGALVGGGG